jgi:hypothetical protein
MSQVIDKLYIVAWRLVMGKSQTYNFSFDCIHRWTSNYCMIVVMMVLNDHTVVDLWHVGRVLYVIKFVNDLWHVGRVLYVIKFVNDLWHVGRVLYVIKFVNDLWHVGRVRKSQTYNFSFDCIHRWTSNYCMIVVMMVLNDHTVVPLWCHGVDRIDRKLFKREKAK